MPTASTLEIFSTTGKFITAFGDVPALSVLKPIGSILVAICDHVTVLKDNQEAAIMVAERVDQAVRVLINHTQDLDGATLENYLTDIKSFERTLLKISSSLQNLRQGNGLLRFLSPKADAAEFNRLCSQLDYTIRIFGLSANLEARKTHQLIQALVPKGGSELHCTAINTSTLRPHKVLYDTADYLVQVGTHNNQAVVVKVYYPTEEERFAQHLRQRRKLIHPGIACMIGSSDEASIMLFCAEDLLFCPQNTIDINRVRDAWKHERIGPQIESGDMGRQSTHRPSTSHPSPYVRLSLFETLTIKESAALLQQFIGVVQFLGKMKVEVAWWEFKPSWVGLRGRSQLTLIDWDRDSKLMMGKAFEPQYAIHVMGLVFSDTVPEAFQDSEWLFQDSEWLSHATTNAKAPSRQRIAFWSNFISRMIESSHPSDKLAASVPLPPPALASAP